MQMITLFAAAALCASANAAKLTNTPQDFVNVKAGQPFTITWAEASGPVTVLLKNGPSTNLNTVSTITSDQTGNSFVWTPSSTLPEDQYALEIVDSGAPNYSVQFPISGGSGTPSSSASSYTSMPSYSSSEPAGSYPASTIASTGYSTSCRNATSSGYYTATSASMHPTSSANATSIMTSTSTFLTSSHTTTKPSATTLPDSSFAAGQSSPFALLLLSLASFMFFL